MGAIKLKINIHTLSIIGSCVVSGMRLEKVEAVRPGISEIAKANRLTMGKDGGTVLISKFGQVVPTKDPLSLTMDLSFDGPRRIGASLLRESIRNLSEDIGFDSAHLPILVDYLVSQPYYQLGTEFAYANTLDHQYHLVTSYLNRLCRETTADHLRKIAESVTGGDDKLSECLTRAFDSVGDRGVITLTEGHSRDPSLDSREGLRCEGGWTPQEEEKSPAPLQGPLVAVSWDPLSDFEDVAAILEEASQWPDRGVCIFAPFIYGKAWDTVRVNRGKFPIHVVVHKGKPQNLHDWVLNICAVTTAQAVGSVSGTPPKSFKSEYFGYAREVTIGQKSTMIRSYEDEKTLESIDKRCGSLLASAQNTESTYDRERLLENRASISGGVCQVSVGGVTESEARDRRSKAEAAVKSMRLALEGGVVPGDGWVYLALSNLEGIRGTPLGGAFHSMFVGIHKEKAPERIEALKNGHDLWFLCNHEIYAKSAIDRVICCAISLTRQLLVCGGVILR